MDYDKLYFPKTEMSQLAPIKPHKPLTVQLSDDTYNAYANNFDLSLLPNETELPLSPQSEFSSNSSSPSSLSSSSSLATVSPYNSLSSSTSSPTTNVTLDYIPTTIYHDQTLTPIKIEKTWSDENLVHSSTTLDHTNNSILLEQLQHHYKFYPSPQPSPDHFHLNGPPATINASTVYPPSPCPSIDAKSPYTSQQQHQIKQELHILPPSPPESSCGAPSPHSFADIKQEPDEAFIDINSLLEKSLSSMRQETTNPTNPHDSKPQIVSHQPNHHLHHHHQQQQQQNHNHAESQQPSSQDNQLLREYLEDTTFQKKHNLKPLALETLIGGLGVRGDIEPVISLALEHAKREAEATCNKLQISADPQKWTPPQVHAWLRSTADQFKLPPIIDLELKFPEDGTTLSLLTEEEFVRRAPEAGSTIHAQLEIWKLACSDNFTNNFNANPNNNIVNNTLNTPTTLTTPTTSTATPSVVTDIWNSECIQNNMDMDVSDDDEDETLPPGTINSTPAMASTVSSNGGPTAASSPPTKTPTGRTGGSHIHLWQFLKELLATPHVNGTAIRWIDRSKGVFKIEDSVRVAKLWGRRKNRPAMNYDKLSRSIRQYYKKGIMKKTERSQRLVYQFCHPYCL